MFKELSFQITLGPAQSTAMQIYSVGDKYYSTVEDPDKGLQENPVPEEVIAELNSGLETIDFSSWYHSWFDNELGDISWYLSIDGAKYCGTDWFPNQFDTLLNLLEKALDLWLDISLSIDKYPGYIELAHFSNYAHHLHNLFCKREDECIKQVYAPETAASICAVEIPEDLRKELVDLFLPYYQDLVEDVALFKKDKPWCSAYLTYIDDLSNTLEQAVSSKQSSVYYNLPIVGKIAVLIAMCSDEDQDKFHFGKLDSFQKLCILTELLYGLNSQVMGDYPYTYTIEAL